MTAAAPGDGPAARLIARIAAEGDPWPGPIEHHARLGSTNDRLKDLARAGAPEWAVVLADVQTAGRGRHGRAWTSAAGNLHLSVLVRPRGAPATWGRLPLIAGLAVAEALEAPGVDPRVKWPNDVWIGGRKVAGVLVESASAGAGIESAVIGIGVNVTSVPDGLDAETRAGAACLSDFDASRDANAVAAAVLARIRVWYHRLAAGGGDVIAAWRQRALPWWGRRVEARSGCSVVRGAAEAVDEDGALILRLDDGTRAVLHSGEVREVRADGTAVRP